MKNIYVCVGLIVRDTKADKVGRVVVADSATKMAVIRDERSYWTQRYNCLEVASYREVQ